MLHVTCLTSPKAARRCLDSQAPHRIADLNAHAHGCSADHKVDRNAHAHGQLIWHVAQTYYKMSYVDRTIDNPEHRLCEDIPRFCDGVSDLLREVVNAAVDAVVFTVLLRRYSRTHKYTLAIVGYVFGAGVMTLTFMPNFSRMNRKQQELEGAHRHLLLLLLLFSRDRRGGCIAIWNMVDMQGWLACLASLIQHAFHLIRRLHIRTMCVWQGHGAC